MSNDINLGKDWEIVGNDGGNLVIKDKQNGNTYTLKPDGSIGRPLLSSPPSSPSAGDSYQDDGTNTASGNTALRIYNGTSWVDQN
jgi:hypothetical protein